MPGGFNPIDFLILAVVAAALFLAIRSMRRDKKAGKCSCGGDCGSCGACSACQKPEKKK